MRQSGDLTTASVTGTLADGTGAVAGAFDVDCFTVSDGALNASGRFTGTVTTAGGVISGAQQLALPVDVAASNGGHHVLDLVLGPSTLRLLGVPVRLDQVHLNVTVQRGPGLAADLVAAAQRPRPSTGAVVDCPS